MLCVMWSPQQPILTINLFEPSAQPSVPWQIYDDNPARHKRLTAAELGGLRSLNLGKSDGKLGIGPSGMGEACEGVFSRIHVGVDKVIEYGTCELLLHQICERQNESGGGQLQGRAKEW